MIIKSFEGKKSILKTSDIIKTFADNNEKKKLKVCMRMW